MLSFESDAKFFRSNKFNSQSIIKIFIIAAGLIFIGCPFVDDTFLNSLNELTGRACLPLSAGAAFVVYGLSFNSRWERAGFWFSLALIGHAVALQLINAGSALRYQHYKAFDEIVLQTPVLFVFLVFQLLLVLIGIIRSRAKITGWLKNNLKAWQVLLISGFFLIPTATVSEDVNFYVQEWIFAGFIQILNLGNIFLFALSIPSGSREKFSRVFRRLLNKLEDQTDTSTSCANRFVLGLAVFVVVAASFLNIFSYERHPHVPDEIAYLTHARFFANGALTMPAPPVPEAFDAYLLKHEKDRWYPTPPPGWSVVLAVGVFFGVPWLVNPVLGGLNIILAYLLIKRLYSTRIACVSVFLIAFSPWYLFLSMSFMTHILTLTCALIAALAVSFSRQTEKAYWAWVGGLTLGFISLVRPLEALALAVLLGLWAIGWGGKRLKPAGIAGLVLGAMIIGGLGLLYNSTLTGDPLRFPINAYTDEHFGPNSNAYGFGPDRGMGWEFDPNPGHSPFDALVNTNLNVSTLNTELLGWSIGSFLLIAIFFCFGRLKQSDYLMLAVIGLIYLLHFFYYFSGGPDFAARYWFLMFIPLIVLTARGIESFGAKLDESKLQAGGALYITVATLCLMAAINFVCWRAIDKYHNFRGMRPDVRYLAETNDFGKSLVLIRGNQHPDFDSAMIYNPLDFQADAPIYAWDRDAETRKKLLAFYADRPVWIIESPSLTKRGFKVVAGPLSAEEVLEKKVPETE